MKSSCPLCHNESCYDYFEFHKANNFYKYYQCNQCSLVFMDKNILLKASDERSRYEHHHNDKRTPGYEKFLRVLINPVLERVTEESTGLDYGSGPYPMLAEIIEEDGYQIEIYDPFFANDSEKLKLTYDYITCCEVAEHFYDPRLEFEKLHELLKPNGVLGIRTEILTSDIDFSKWHYKQDDTHVVFYTPETIKWICNEFNFSIDLLEKNIAILRRAIS